MSRTSSLAFFIFGTPERDDPTTSQVAVGPLLGERTGFSYHGSVEGEGTQAEEPDLLSWDIDPWADSIPSDEWRSLDSVAKMRIVSEMSLALHRRTIARLAARYPDDSEDDLKLRAACLRAGPDVVERLTGRKLQW